MILELGRGAQRLDAYLQRRLGWPYNIFLAVGLGAEVVERVRGLTHSISSIPKEVELVLILVMELALLLHQISVLSHHLDRRHGDGAE